MRECVVIEGVRTPTGKSGWKGMAKGGNLQTYLPRIC